MSHLSCVLMFYHIGRTVTNKGLCCIAPLTKLKYCSIVRADSGAQEAIGHETGGSFLDTWPSSG